MTITVPRAIGELERLAYERAEQDLQIGSERGIWFDEDAADAAVKFFDFLVFTKGRWAKEPFILEPWEEFCVRQIFGWKRADGTRRFREALIEVARKNGKTEFMAGLGLLMMLADGEAAAEVYSAATKKDQARIVWEAAERMVRFSRHLRSKVNPLRGNLHHLPTASKFEPLASDSDTLDGLNPSCGIIDELHAHKTRGVYDILDTAQGAREQPLLISITTAGIYDPTSIGWIVHAKAAAVLRGSLEDDAFFAFICAADEGDDFTDAKTWEKANPSIGVSISYDYLQRQCDKAKEEASFLNTFRRYHLNIWTSQVTAWINPLEWQKGNMKAELDELIGQPCFGGLDLSSNIDLTAFALLFPDEDGYFDLLMQFWCPEDNIQARSREDRVPYDIWAEQGWINPTPGNVIDHDYVIADILKLCKPYDLQEIAFDRWGATHVVNRLMDEGLEVVEIGQGYATMSAPSKELERIIKQAKLAHRNNPVLNWMISNVTVTEDPAGNIKPAKDKSIGRIDGVVALIMALERYMRHQEENPYYPSGGLFVV